MRLGKRGCIALMTIVLMAPALAQELKPVSQPEELGFASDRLERVTTAFQGYVDNGQLPGAVVLIARNDKIAYVKAFGYPGSPNKLSDAAAGRWISGQRGGSRSVRCHETGSFCWSCTLGESGYWAAQPPRVPEPDLGTRRGAASRYGGGGEAQDAA